MQHYDKLIKKYKDIVEKEPNSHKALHNLAKLYVKSKNKIKALDCYEQLYAVMPDNFDVLRSLGLLYLVNGYKSTAIELFKKALLIKEDAKEVYEYVTQIDKYHEEKCFELALSLYDENKLTQAEALHAIKVSKRLYKEGNYEMAERYIKLASNVNANSAEINNMLGVMCFQNKQFNRAIYFYNNALNALKKDNIVLYFNIVYAYREKNDEDKVYEYLEKICELKYSNKHVLCMAANIYKSMGNIEKAKEYFEKSLELDERFENAKKGLSSLDI